MSGPVRRLATGHSPAISRNLVRTERSDQGRSQLMRVDLALSQLPAAIHDDRHAIAVALHQRRIPIDGSRVQCEAQRLAQRDQRRLGLLAERASQRACRG